MSDPFDTPGPSRGGSGYVDDAGTERDRYGRPKIPADPYDTDSWAANRTPHTRVSTMASAVSDMFALGQWQQRMTAKGLALRPDLLSLAGALDVKADREQLNEVCANAQKAAESDKGANHGTALHALTRRLDHGEPMRTVSRSTAEHLKGDIEAYDEGVAKHHLSVLSDHAGPLTERLVVIPELRAAGTFDKIMNSPAWPLPRIADTKSAQEIEHSALSIAVQLAMYAHGAAIWDGRKSRYEPMPKVDQETAVVLWLPAGAGRLEVLEVDIERGWDMALTCMKVRDARRSAKGWLRPCPPPTIRATVEEPVPEPPIPAALDTVGGLVADPARLDTPALPAAPEVTFPPVAEGWLGWVQRAKSAEELSAIRKRALAAGEWTDALLAAGRARLAEIRALTS